MFAELFRSPRGGAAPTQQPTPARVPRSVMWRSNPCKQFQLLRYLNERHITGIATKQQYSTRMPESRDRHQR